LLNPGQSLDVGDRRLVGFRPPLWDNPATVGALDPSTGVCFSSDCFGAALPNGELAAADEVGAATPDELRAGQQLWASVDSPWVQQVDRARFAASLEPLRTFDPSWVFSVHLPPAHGRITDLLASAAAAPDTPEFVGPDQAALEAVLASFEPA
jgi:hypothetical protein